MFTAREMCLIVMKYASMRNVQRRSLRESLAIQLKIYPSRLIHSRAGYRLYIEFQWRIARNLSNSTRARHY